MEIELTSSYTKDITKFIINTKIKCIIIKKYTDEYFVYDFEKEDLSSILCIIAEFQPNINDIFDKLKSKNYFLEVHKIDSDFVKKMIDNM